MPMATQRLVVGRTGLSLTLEGSVCLSWLLLADSVQGVQAHAKMAATLIEGPRVVLRHYWLPE